MRGALGQRVVQYGLVLLLAATVNFALPRAMPGSPLAYLAGEDVGLLPAEDRARYLRAHGLDRPVAAQYADYLLSLARGDLGRSFQHRRPVTAVLRERLVWSLLLGGSALALATASGVTLGGLAAWHRGRPADLAATAVCLGLEATPGFWLGMLLIGVGGVQLGWFPTFGARDPLSGLTGAAYWLDVAHHLALPLLTLTLVTVPGLFLTMRASLVAVLGQEYIRTARAKGLGESRVLWRHAARNARLPVVTAFLLGLGQVVAGATVVETVFSYPGVGRLLYEAVLARDYPLLQGGFLLVTAGVALANLVADLAYPWLDPRVPAEP